MGVRVPRREQITRPTPTPLPQAAFEGSKRSSVPPPFQIDHEGNALRLDTSKPRQIEIVEGQAVLPPRKILLYRSRDLKAVPASYLKGLKEELQQDNCRVFPAETREELLAVLASRSPDIVIICEYTLQHINDWGFSLVQEVRALAPLAQVFLVIESPDYDKAVVKQCPTDYFFVVPFDLDRFLLHVSRALVRQQRDLEQAVQQKSYEQHEHLAEMGLAMAGIVHDLTNLVYELFNYLDLAILEVPKLLPGPIVKSLQAHLSAAEQACGKILLFLKGMRGLGQITSEQSVFEPNDIIRQAASLVRVKAKKAEVTLELNLEGNDFSAFGNPGSLLRAVFNLLNNAIEATPPRGFVRLCISKTADDMIKIDVSDTGHGIRPESLGKIFDPDFTTKRATGGTGLGLSIVKQCLDELQGWIVVLTEPGKGTTFTLFIPQNSNRTSSATE